MSDGWEEYVEELDALRAENAELKVQRDELAAITTIFLRVWEEPVDGVTDYKALMADARAALSKVKP